MGVNSLLELVAFGRQAADTTAELVKPNSPPVKLPAKAGEARSARMNKMRDAKGHIPTAECDASCKLACRSMFRSIAMPTTCPRVGT